MCNSVQFYGANFSHRLQPKSPLYVRHSHPLTSQHPRFQKTTCRLLRAMIQGYPSYLPIVNHQRLLSSRLSSDGVWLHLPLSANNYEYLPCLEPTHYFFAPQHHPVLAQCSPLLHQRLRFLEPSLLPLVTVKEPPFLEHLDSDLSLPVAPVPHVLVETPLSSIAPFVNGASAYGHSHLLHLD